MVASRAHGQKTAESGLFHHGLVDDFDVRAFPGEVSYDFEDFRRVFVGRRSVYEIAGQTDARKQTHALFELRLLRGARTVFANEHETTFAVFLIALVGVERIRTERESVGTLDVVDAESGTEYDVAFELAKKFSRFVEERVFGAGKEHVDPVALSKRPVGIENERRFLGEVFSNFFYERFRQGEFGEGFEILFGCQFEHEMVSRRTQQVGRKAEIERFEHGEGIKKNGTGPIISAKTRRAQDEISQLFAKSEKTREKKYGESKGEERDFQDRERRESEEISYETRERVQNTRSKKEVAVEMMERLPFGEGDRRERETEREKQEWEESVHRLRIERPEIQKRGHGEHARKGEIVFVFGMEVELEG